MSEKPLKLTEYFFQSGLTRCFHGVADCNCCVYSTDSFFQGLAPISASPTPEPVQAVSQNTALQARSSANEAPAPSAPSSNLLPMASSPVPLPAAASTAEASQVATSLQLAGDIRPARSQRAWPGGAGPADVGDESRSSKHKRAHRLSAERSTSGMKNKCGHFSYDWLVGFCVLVSWEPNSSWKKFVRFFLLKLVAALKQCHRYVHIGVQFSTTVIADLKFCTQFNFIFFVLLAEYRRY